MAIHDLVDLSVPLNERTQTYPGDPELRFLPHSTVQRDGFNLLAVHMGTQTGTHVDAPFHFEDDAPRLDELPLSRFVGPGVVADVTGLDARTPITRDHLADVLARTEPGTIVLLHTGWSRHFGTERYFDHPYLDADACRALLDAGVRTIGIDAINLDETPDDSHPGVGFPVHHLIAKAQGVICENLTNLAAVRSAAPTVSLLPIAFTGTDGAPVRAVAYEER
ncbi:MAG TPA: cyclase family protein [Amnibacterium sp.]|uniref:cyclase family protein n=1 Tax=Amnibacterium sp. TaxID=1872496 RepID=UPI002F945376